MRIPSSSPVDTELVLPTALLPADISMPGSVLVPTHEFLTCPAVDPLLNNDLGGALSEGTDVNKKAKEYWVKEEVRRRNNFIHDPAPKPRPAISIITTQSTWNTRVSRCCHHAVSSR